MWMIFCGVSSDLCSFLIHAYINLFIKLFLYELGKIEFKLLLRIVKNIVSGKNQTWANLGDYGRPQYSLRYAILCL